MMCADYKAGDKVYLDLWWDLAYYGTVEVVEPRVIGVRAETIEKNNGDLIEEGELYYYTADAHFMSLVKQSLAEMDLTE